MLNYTDNEKRVKYNLRNASKSVELKRTYRKNSGRAFELYALGYVVYSER